MISKKRRPLGTKRLLLSLPLLLLACCSSPSGASAAATDDNENGGDVDDATTNRQQRRRGPAPITPIQSSSSSMKRQSSDGNKAGGRGGNVDSNRPSLTPSKPKAGSSSNSNAGSGTDKPEPAVYVDPLAQAIKEEAKGAVGKVDAVIAQREKERKDRIEEVGRQKVERRKEEHAAKEREARRKFEESMSRIGAHDDAEVRKAIREANKLTYEQEMTKLRHVGHYKLPKNDPFWLKEEEKEVHRIKFENEMFQIRDNEDQYLIKQGDFYTEELNDEIRKIASSGVDDMKVHEFIQKRKKEYLDKRVKVLMDEFQVNVMGLETLEDGTLVPIKEGGDKGGVARKEKAKESAAAAAQPSSQPTAQSSNNSKDHVTSTPTASDMYTYQSTYEEIFHPRLEEYDMMKFDPYSFSGAPLGGWGRATRSRLASLPIRLVSDFEGGMDLLYGTVGAESLDDLEVVEGESVNKEDTKEQSGDAAVDDMSDNKEEATASESKQSTVSSEIKPSTGPHFTVHDATGQKYICRVYAEEELVVLSRLDSVFHPAVTVWDEDSDLAKDAKQSGLKSKGETDVSSEDDGGIHIKKHYQFSIHGGDGDSDNLPEGIRSSVAKMLRKMGMNDAAAALAGQNGGGLDQIANAIDGVGEVEVDVDVRVVDMDGNVMNNDIADIVKAAAIGAGMHGNKKADGGDIKKGDIPGSDKDGEVDTKPKMPPRLSQKQLRLILKQLEGMCSQLHLGWWSYEWCHDDQIRQFHVAVSNNPDKGPTPKYEIQDITSVGKFMGEMSIIYPRGWYDGEFMKGITTSFQLNRKGNPVNKKIQYHSTKEDEKYGMTREDVLFGNSMDKKKKRQMMEMNKKLGHGGPIIQQVFSGGDFCPEVGHDRKMNVELRCCTEEEIDHWLDSRTHGATPAQRENDPHHKKKKDPTPKAVLVSVQEDETCVYRSRVCTPLLCPKPVAEERASSTAAGDNHKAESEKQKLQKIRERQKTDPMGALLAAIFGDEGEVIENAGEVQVFFPDDITGEQFQDLMDQAQAGLDFTVNPAFQKVRDALLKSKKGGKKVNMKDLFADGGDDVDDVTMSDFRSLSVMDVKEGESIREILDKTLGKRPCLMKNLGWWTYEFCHKKEIRQYHANNLIDATTGMAKQKIETEHILGVYADSGNDLGDYPNSDEYKYVINATDSSSADWGVGSRKAGMQASVGNKNERQPGGNGAVYVQEYKHGDVCDHEDVAESVIKGGNVVHGSVERASKVRFSCGKRWELIDIKEDSTCHYVLDVTVPELCQHSLFKAPVTKTQVVKCLPV